MSLKRRRPASSPTPLPKWWFGLHTGAGYYSTGSCSAARSCMKAAYELISTEMERDGADMVQVCVLACQVLEDDVLTNAGVGCNLSSHGIAEADALLCDSSGCSGAVAAVPGVRNPIIAASIVHSNRKLETILGLVQPNLLAGQGARLWVEARMPSLLCSNDDLITSTSRTKFQRALHSLQQRQNQDSNCRQDTVGVVMMRADGFCCCAISSGGTQLKSSGRVGHAALVGAGGCSRTFENCSVSACCSGTGEDIIERYLAYRVVHGVARDGPEYWAELCAESFEVPTSRAVHLGCIGLHKANDERRCSVVVAHTTPAMAVCWGSSNGMQANFVSKLRDRNSPLQGNRIVTQCSILK